MDFKIAAIDHLVLNCSDVHSIAEWYQRALGVEVELMMTVGPRWFLGRSELGCAPLARMAGLPAVTRHPGRLMSALKLRRLSPQSPLIGNLSELRWSMDQFNRQGLSVGSNRFIREILTAIWSRWPATSRRCGVM